MKNYVSRLIVLSAMVAFFAVSCFQKNGTLKNGTVSGSVSYNFDIRPILSDKCFACHDPDSKKREAGLRLDVAESAYAKFKDGKGVAIFPGKPEQSEVYKRITSVDPSYQMPTPESHLGLLNENEIGLMRKWIEQGARYEKHWAFTAPVLPAVPEVSDESWPKNEIDHFVLQKMEDAGLSPNEEADQSHLLKKVALDITGLPPTLEMQNKFEADGSGKAYEK